MYVTPSLLIEHVTVRMGNRKVDKHFENKLNALPELLIFVH